MKTSEEGVKFIASWEGLLLRAEIDKVATPEGSPHPLWNIGYGHTAAAGPPVVHPGMEITKEEALAILASDLARVEERVVERFGHRLLQNGFDGAVSFDFNTGGLFDANGEIYASWPKFYLERDMELARYWLMKWVRAGGVTVPGLVRRREAEAGILFQNIYKGA